ncbi:MAG: M17 family peptidase N-terminal domain-containing protein [Nannocystales bacterium]
MTPSPRGRSLARGRVQLRLEALQRDVLDGLPEADEPGRVRGDVAIIPWFADERPFQGLLGLLDWRRDGSLSSLARDGVAHGIWKEQVLLPAGRGLPVDRIVLLGCGDRERFDAEAAASIGAQAAKVAVELRPQSVLVGMPTGCAERDVLESLFLGLVRGIEDSAQDDPEAVWTTPTHPWWVVVEERHIARLRRLLDGPPRAATQTTSSS